jgi:dolichol kinase
LQGSSYHRRERKLLHLAGGAFAFCLPFIPYWLALAGGCGAVLLAYWLKPSFSPWLNSICKPEDRASGHIGGLRGYATTLLILLVGWRLLEPSDPAALRYAMFGWTALAFGDGLAGLVGPGPRVAPTVPWNRHKTWWGFVGSVLGIALAFAGCFLLPLPGVPLPATGPQLAILLLPLALAGAIVESLSLPLDDNYVVGLSCPVLAWVALQFV